MRYFIDTEYSCVVRLGAADIIPISVGIVAEDGREFYRVNEGVIKRYVNMFGEPRPELTPFVEEHVLSVALASLDYGDYSTEVIVGFSMMAGKIKRFIGDDAPEFWGDYADFDYVVLSTIMGGFDAWPDGWPMFINDCQQAGIVVGPSAIPHHALADARAIRDGVMGQLR